MLNDYYTLSISIIPHSPSLEIQTIVDLTLVPDVFPAHLLPIPSLNTKPILNPKILISFHSLIKEFKDTSLKKISKWLDCVNTSKVESSDLCCEGKRQNERKGGRRRDHKGEGALQHGFLLSACVWV